MNCVLFAKMDQVFSLKKKHLKNTGKMAKNTGKIREFCQSGKMGTLIPAMTSIFFSEMKTSDWLQCLKVRLQQIPLITSTFSWIKLLFVSGTQWWYLATAIFNSVSALSSSFYHCDLWIIERKRSKIFAVAKFHQCTVFENKTMSHKKNSPLVR